MYDLCLLGIALHVSRHAVRETHADSYEHVGFLLFQVYGIRAVHSEHTHIEPVIGWQGRETEHGATYGDVGFLKECLQFLLCVAQFYALSYECHWLLCVVNEFGSSLQVLFLWLWIWHV